MQRGAFRHGEHTTNIPGKPHAGIWIVLVSAAAIGATIVVYAILRGPLPN